MFGLFFLCYCDFIIIIYCFSIFLYMDLDEVVINLIYPSIYLSNHFFVKQSQLSFKNVSFVEQFCLMSGRSSLQERSSSSALMERWD